VAPEAPAWGNAPSPYLCPVCRVNRSRFAWVFRIEQEVTKDPDTGALLHVADEWEVCTRDGLPDLEVVCLDCGHRAPERDFIRAVLREERQALRPRHLAP